jgi:hypothetical protein
VRRIEGFTAVVRSVLLGRGWGRSEPLIGELEGGAFALRVRHGYSNGLTRILRGHVVEAPGGCKIVGELRTLWWVVLVLRCVWLFNLYLASKVLWASSVPATALVPLFVTAFVMGIEAFGRHLGDRDEETIRRTFAKAFSDARA